jgi:16S rRNA (adenine1518-N6/adenine1519-N6)-dimethyltransferase
MVRLGQNFLADPNLLDAIVRESGAGEGDVVLEVGGGEGALTERLAAVAERVWVVEIDTRLKGSLGAVVDEHHNIEVVWGDAMEVELSALDPTPTRVVSNLPYSIATPLILRTVAELTSVGEWTVMVQREIADRLRAAPGSRTYGAPSATVQLSCEVEMVRAVDRAVFRPRPRVDSALLRLRRVAAAPAPGTAALIRGAFAHRRKTLAGSLELVGVADRPRVREALAGMGLEVDARAESLRPKEFAVLAARLGLGD